MNIQIDPMTNLPQVPEGMFWRVATVAPEELDYSYYPRNKFYRTKPTLQLELHLEIDGGVGWFGRNLPKKSKVVGSRMFYEFISAGAVDVDKFLEEHPNEGWNTYDGKQPVYMTGGEPVVLGVHRYQEPTPELFKSMGKSIWQSYINHAHMVALTMNERYIDTRKHNDLVNKYVGDYPPKRLED